MKNLIKIILPCLLMTFLYSCLGGNGTSFEVINEAGKTVIDTSSIKCLSQADKILNIQLNTEGTTQFEAFTKKNVTKTVSLSICNEKSRPIVIQAIISTGKLLFSLDNEKQFKCAKQLIAMKTECS